MDSRIKWQVCLDAKSLEIHTVFHSSYFISCFKTPYVLFSFQGTNSASGLKDRAVPCSLAGVFFLPSDYFPYSHCKTLISRIFLLWGVFNIHIQSDIILYWVSCINIATVNNFIVGEWCFSSVFKNRCLRVLMNPHPESLTTSCCWVWHPNVPPDLTAYTFLAVLWRCIFIKTCSQAGAGIYVPTLAAGAWSYF